MEFLKNRLFMVLLMTLTIHFSKSAKDNVNIFDLKANWNENELLQETALFMLDNMNLTTNPCEDFYEYSCGNWPNNNRVSKQYRKNTFTDIITNYMWKKLEHKLMSDKEPNVHAVKSPMEKAKIFFNSCLISGRTSTFIKAIHILFCKENRKFKKLKLRGQKDDWLAVNFMSPYNVFPLVNIKVLEQDTESGKFEVAIDGNFKLQDYYDKNRQDFSRAIGKCQKQFQHALEFEAKVLPYYRIIKTAQRLPLKKFLKLYDLDGVDWKKAFSYVFPGKLPDDLYVNNYFTNINHLAEYMKSARIEDVLNYVKWCTVAKFFEIWKLVIFQNVETRRRKCRELTETYFTSPLLSWFKENFYDSERHKDISHIARTIKADFYNTVENNYTWLNEDYYSWLSNETRANVLRKLENLKIIVSYKENMLHRNLFYDKLDITWDFFKNLQILEINHVKKLKRLINRKITEFALEELFDVDSHYYPNSNTVFIRMNLAQMPFYHLRYPAALKFGGIGWVIAFELAHAFDSKKEHFVYDDKNNSYSKHIWLSSDTLNNFTSRYDCLFDQYKSFVYKGLHADKSSLMTDNIADNAGLHLAYYSYLDWKGPQKLEVLPGTDFTNDQLFFIKYAQQFCFNRNSKEETLRRRNESGMTRMHPELRVLVPLRNMQKFAETFKCPTNAPMNPSKKCVVW